MSKRELKGVEEMTPFRRCSENPCEGKSAQATWKRRNVKRTRVTTSFGRIVVGQKMTHGKKIKQKKEEGRYLGEKHW